MLNLFLNLPVSKIMSRFHSVLQQRPTERVFQVLRWQSSLPGYEWPSGWRGPWGFQALESVSPRLTWPRRPFTWVIDSPEEHRTQTERIPSPSPHFSCARFLAPAPTFSLSVLFCRVHWLNRKNKWEVLDLRYENYSVFQNSFSDETGRSERGDGFNSQTLEP